MSQSVRTHVSSGGQAASGVGPSPVQPAQTTTERYQEAMLRYLDAVAGQPTPPAPVKRSGRAPATTVRDVMTRAVVAAHLGAGYKAIIAALARNRIGAVPVIDDERKVVGVVSETDLLARLAAASRPHSGRHTSASQRKLHGLTALELMTAPAVTVRAHVSIADAARIAARHRVRQLPVVDAKGALLGIVSRADLLTVFLRADDDIREQVDHYAAATMHLQPEALEVDVEAGVVTLAGNLRRLLQVRQLEDYVRSIPGVVDLHSRLTATFDDRFLPAPTEPSRS